MHTYVTPTPDYLRFAWNATPSHPYSSGIRELARCVFVLDGMGFAYVDTLPIVRGDHWYQSWRDGSSHAHRCAPRAKARSAVSI